MKLSSQGLQQRQAWEELGYHLPQFNEEKMRAHTMANPEWIHFGAGNIFRAYQANVVQNLLNEGVLESGLIVAEGYDYDIIEKAYKDYDNYGILVTLKANGTVEKTVVGSVAEALTVDRENALDWERLKEIFRNDTLKMVSFTITEKGYSLVDSKENLLPAIAEDFQVGPQKATSYLGKVVALLHERFANGEKPVAFVSMDNCSHNGDKLHDAVYAIAQKWAENGLVDAS